jgi:hypothetical protein
MSTVINTPPTRESADSAAGWAVSVIILLAVIGVGAYLWAQRQAPAPTTNNEGDEINLTIPNVTVQGGTSTAQ